uniref:lipid-A-disaccharide synthase n=1 Tax=Peronospora matthiolae TaxID=2874970 RepID=A0AAV1TX82_9STRA
MRAAPANMVSSGVWVEASHIVAGSPLVVTSIETLDIFLCSKKMWGSRYVSTRVFQRRCCSVSLSTTSTSALEDPLKLYVVAGEASGDAIGAKVVRALQRQQPSRALEVRGIGGPKMCEAGRFKSLFPMHELSIMGLFEVVPHIWRVRRRIQDTLRDIHQFQPELVLTIDSKGFAFRVLKALQAKERRTGCKRSKKVHYVAPSVWAYKHRGKRHFAELAQLLDAMFTILPFEEDLFGNGESNERLEGGRSDKSSRSWCHFVGHPAVEDFLEATGAYESDRSCLLHTDDRFLQGELTTGPGALLDLEKYDAIHLLANGRHFQRLAASGRESRVRDRVREKFGIPVDAFVICALVGSRTNEVDKVSQLVLDAIERFQRTKDMQRGRQQIFVVFPTLSVVEKQVKAHLSASNHRVPSRVLTDLDAATRLELFQSSDAAVAMSGTIVLETTLASLPTVVIYRANRLTERVVQWLAAVRFVSVPNLMLGRMLIPELLFRDCTAPKIAEALASLQHHPSTEKDAPELAIVSSTLSRWHESDKVSATSSRLQPIRPSDLAAKYILEILAEK